MKSKEYGHIQENTSSVSRASMKVKRSESERVGRIHIRTRSRNNQACFLQEQFVIVKFIFEFIVRLL